MKTLYRNGFIYTSSGFKRADFGVIDGIIRFSCLDDSFYDSVIDINNKYVIPGLADVHVHLREPGFSYKETIRSGTMAAAKGGYTLVASMPNLKPVPSNLENLNVQLDIIKKDALIDVIPYGTITDNQSGRGELSKMAEMQDYVIGFTDDGKGVQSKELMKEAMLEAKKLNKPIVAHCEDESLINGGYIHEGEYALQHGHAGISSRSEWIDVQRDIELAKQTGVQYHICHVSTKESVALIREAKKKGLRVTAETAPHYLTLCDEDLREDGYFKMNPPIRSKEDRVALIEGIKDGTIEVIATDHAPHSKEEKSKGLKGSSFGIVGLETAFSNMYTKLVLKGVITLEELVKLMSVNPRKIFNLKEIYIEDGYSADFTVIDLEKEYVIDSEKFVSMGKATPFNGEKVKSEIMRTVYQGNTVFSID